MDKISAYPPPLLKQIHVDNVKDIKQKVYNYRRPANISLTAVPYINFIRISKHYVRN